MIQSNKCSIEWGSRKDRYQVFRTPYQKWEKEMVNIYKKEKNIRVIVQAIVSSTTSYTKLLIIDCDFKSKKYRYSIASYITILAKALPNFYKLSLLFIQDNTPIYNTNTIKLQFKENYIELLKNQLLYLLDLNLIKYLQQYLKNLIYKI